MPSRLANAIQLHFKRSESDHISAFPRNQELGGTTRRRCHDDFTAMITISSSPRNTMPDASPIDQTIDDPRDDEGPVEGFMRLTKTARLLRSIDGRCYAKVQVGSRPDVSASGQERLHPSPGNCAALPPTSACTAYPMHSTKTTENV